MNNHLQKKLERQLLKKKINHDTEFKEIAVYNEYSLVFCHRQNL